MKRLVVFALTLTACGSSSVSNDEESARAKFWTAFYAQHYDELPEVMDSLQATSAGARDPAQHELLIAHSNLWKVAEWGRVPGQNQSEIPQYVAGARTHFQAAADLNPSDFRIPGWLGATVRNTGTLLGDPALVSAGDELIATGVEKYPEFNLFIHAIVRSRAPRGSPELAEAIDAMWRNLDACYDEAVDREALDINRYKSQETDSGVKRVCWNTAKAPHNYEGFFLYFGDFLRRNGEDEKARMVYDQARVVAGYETWPYRTMLEERMNGEPQLISGSDKQCSACHAR